MFKRKARKNIFVSFLITASLLVTSSPVLAAMAKKCCKNKLMACKMTDKTRHANNRACHLSGQMAAGDEYAHSENRSTQHYDPIKCCEKNCYPQLGKTINGKQLVYKKTGVTPVATFIRVDAAIEFEQQRTSRGYTRDGPLPLHSPPLYSLNSAYLI